MVNGKTISIEFDISSFVKRARQSGVDIDKNVAKATFSGANLIRNQILSLMNEPKSGRMYGNHQASAPDQAPAPDTGALRNSIFVEQVDISALVGSTLEYSKFLELGTTTILARPFLLPAYEISKKQILNKIKKAIKDSL